MQARDCVTDSVAQPNQEADTVVQPTPKESVDPPPVGAQPVRCKRGALARVWLKDAVGDALSPALGLKYAEEDAPRVGLA